MKKKLTVLVEKTNSGFSASTEKYPVYTAGNTLDEILLNIVESMNLYLKHLKKPLISVNDVELKLQLDSFFAYYKVINVKALSIRIGMNQTLLSQYIKGRKSPSTKQRQRILDGVHKVARELLEVKMI